MGFILLNVRDKNRVQTLRFFYGRYEDGKWLARLSNDDGCSQASYSYQSVSDLCRKLARTLVKIGQVRGIWGNPAENSFIGKLRDQLKS